MPRRYTTMGEVVDQLKVNNETNIDIKSGIHSLEGDFGRFFSYLARDRREQLEAKREAAHDKARGATARGGGKKGPGKPAATGLLGGLGAMFSGMGAGAAGVGIGIGGFFMGLAGAEAIMAKFGSGDNLKNLMINMAEGMAAFSGRDLAALGALLGAGMIFGKVGSAIGMTAVGLGITGFFGALAGGDMAIGAMEATGENLKVFMGNIAEGIGALNTESFIAIGGLLATGAGFAAMFGLKKTGKAAIGMAAIGAGVAGFFGALAVGDKLTKMMDVDGTNLKNMMKNVAEGIGALGDDGFTKVAPLLAAGGVLGALFGVGAAAGAAIGMTAIGAGVAGFIGAMAGVGDLMANVGVSGMGFKEIMGNVAEGVAELNKIQAEGLMTKVGALAALGPALLSVFLGTSTIAAIDGIIDGAKKIINFIFGTDLKDSKTTRKNIIKDTVESLEPLNDIPASLGTKLDAMSGSLLNFVDSFNKAGGDLDPKEFGKKMEALGQSLAYSRELMMIMANGGTLGSGWFDGIKEVSFGEKGSGGLLDPKLKIDDLIAQIQKVDIVMGNKNVRYKEPAATAPNLGDTAGSQGGATAVSIDLSDKSQKQVDQNIMNMGNELVDLEDQMHPMYHVKMLSVF